MSENSQNKVANNNDIKTSQNNASGNRMNKYFAFILTAVIIGGLLWNPIISDVAIGLTHLSSSSTVHNNKAMQIIIAPKMSLFLQILMFLLI